MSELQNRLPTTNVQPQAFDLLWIAAGFSDTENDSFTGMNTMVEFYVINLSDLDVRSDSSLNYSSKMVALKGK